MKMLSIILSLPLLAACAPQTHSDSLQVESKFQPFVTQFLTVANQVGHPMNVTDLTVVMDASIPGPSGSGGSWTLAYCMSGNSANSPRIHVNPVFWNNYSDEAREQVLFHELGHCLLGRVHDDTLIKDPSNFNIYKSIMSTYRFNEVFYGYNYNYYMKELFGMDTSQTPVQSVFYGGVNQWTNVYQTVASSLGFNQEKVYSMSSTTLGEITPGSIAGLGCGNDH